MQSYNPSVKKIDSLQIDNRVHYSFGIIMHVHFGSLFICFIISSFTLVLNPVCAQSSDFLFKSGRTSYRIIVSTDASVTERTSAQELKEYLEQISGARFELSSKPGSRNIFVGYEKGFAIYDEIKPYPDNSECFTVKKIGHDLVIYGGRERGSMYGVYRFLQKYFGIQWYTPYFTKIPTIKKYELRDLEFSEKPIIKYRFTDFFCAQDISWLAHNMMNTISRSTNNIYGVEAIYWGCHTMGDLLPASKYFKTNPEYFAYRNFHRIENGQLCLSNPNVLKIMIDEVLSVIKKYPNYKIYDVSQNDNQRFCTCRLCTKLENEYGGHSGLMIWFVNKVAREVHKKYPDKYIGTFAYQYTRQAPTHIKPNDNVVVRLCDIECCLVHPLKSACCDENKSFMKDLKDWRKLTNNLFIWDYIVNYSNYMAPFPNIQVLGPNLKTFSEYGAVEVFEEAQSGTLGNAFEELKSWVLTQLMWNPNQNTYTLVKKFVNDYYGAAGKDVLDYYNLCLSLIKPNIHMTCFSDPSKAPFTDEFNNESYRILERALSHAENAIIYERVKKVMLQPMALECKRHPRDFYKKGKWPEFKRLLLQYKSYFKVKESPEKFIKTFEEKYSVR